MKPTVGRIVHYVSYGTPGGEYTSECRAAIVTSVPDMTHAPDIAPRCDLAVLKPTGLLFSGSVPYHDGGETPGNPDCPNRPHGEMPFRYCPEPGCGWIEARPKGGTWHWPERV